MKRTLHQRILATAATLILIASLLATGCGGADHHRGATLQQQCSQYQKQHGFFHKATLRFEVFGLLRLYTGSKAPGLTTSPAAVVSLLRHLHRAVVDR